MPRLFRPFFTKNLLHCPRRIDNNGLILAFRQGRRLDWFSCQRSYLSDHLGPVGNVSSLLRFYHDLIYEFWVSGELLNKMRLSPRDTFR